MEKNKSPKKDYKFFASFARLLKQFNPSLFILGFITISIVVVLSILSPVYLRDIINKVSANFHINPYLIVDEAGRVSVLWPKLIGAFAIIIGFYIGISVIRMISSVILIRVSAAYTYKLRKEFRLKIDRLPLSYLDKFTHGELLSRGTNDIDAIAESLNNIIFEIIYAFLMFFSVLIAMFIVEWRLALIAVATIPLQFAITIIIGKSSQKKYRAFQKKTGEMTSLLEENISGFEVVKLYSQEEKAIEKFDKLNKEMYRSNFQSNFLSMLIWPSLRFVGNIGFVAVCVVGGIINDLGGILAFITFLNLFNEPFQMLGEISSTIQTTFAGAERLFSFMDAPEETETESSIEIKKDDVRGKFSFENVKFSYSQDTELITNMNLEINPGDIVAIVGPTGAGKTTLVNLIMRFYEINGGSIKLDNIDIRDLTRQALRSSIGMVLQDTWLFEGSIKNNIRYGRTDATDEEIIEAAKAARAHHFISTLPGGYDFVLTENGDNVSQGQRQLITIARAIISKPKILILDEATSSVDTRTEQAIQEVMNEIMKGRTTFIIAHRLSTIKKAKNIIVMSHGDIVETGNHQELLDANGFYAQLYNAQFLGTASALDET